MSVSVSVAAKNGRSAPAVALLSMPWALPAASKNHDGLDLSGVVMRFGPDRPIYVEGDEARSFYRVVSGVVRTCRFLADGRRQIDAFHMTGEVFGLEAGADHRLTAEAVSDSTVVAYRRRGMEAMIAQDEGLGRWFFSHAMNAMAQAREHSLLLGRGSAAQKVSTFLLEVADRGDSDSVVDLAMSRQDIADYLGVTIETVSRALSQLERDGAIKLSTARRVVLMDRRALRMLSS
jgi:CRP/FNR family nitrogen fixation transcriptional regulator